MEEKAKFNQIKGFIAELAELCDRHGVVISGSIDDIFISVRGDEFYKAPLKFPYGSISGYFPAETYASIYYPEENRFIKLLSYRKDEDGPE